MPDFTIRFEWEEAPRAHAPELNATWARLECGVDEQVITRVESRRSSSVRTGIYVPLFPIAEWMVSNWFFLWDEWRIDAPPTRHNLLAAREGFALPDLTFHPTESHMELTWKRVVAPYSGLEFLSEGTALVHKAAVREQFAQLIEAVVERLDVGVREDRGVGSSLVTEWQALKDVLRNDEQRAFCERAARLGFDPFAIDESVAGQIETLGSVLPEVLIDDFCDAIPSTEIASGAEAVRSFIESAAPTARRSGRWNDAREMVAAKADVPWRDGYRQATAFRSFLGLNGHSPDDLGDYLSEAIGGFDSRDFAAPPRIDAISYLADDSGPVFGIPVCLRPEKKRFAIARAVGDFLNFGESSLITRSRTEHQQRNRAFAAEFLAPAHSIRARISRDTVDDEDVELLANEFRVSEFVIRHQIQNHRLAACSA
jgi:hypothetical protein